MDSLHEQIANLSAKIDALHQLIEQLNHRLVVANEQAAAVSVQQGLDAFDEEMVGYQSFHHHGSLETEVGHKDILADVELVDGETHPADQQNFSPDIQVQRLTAQLTAAYNRIAALEEQLLSQRVH